MSPVPASRPPLLPWPLRGVAAGYVGVAAMTLAYYAERRVARRIRVSRGKPQLQGAGVLADGRRVSGLAGQTGLDYDDSVVPGQIIARLLPLPRAISAHPGEIAIALRWSYGSAFGLAHVFIRHRIKEPVASLLFGSLLLGVTFSMFPLLGDTPPPWRWSTDVVATAIGTHVVYVVAVAATDEILR